MSFPQLQLGIASSRVEGAKCASSGEFLGYQPEGCEGARRPTIGVDVAGCALGLRRVQQLRVGRGEFQGCVPRFNDVQWESEMVHFSHAHVNALIVQQADMRGSDFTMCDLSMSLFEDSKLEECDFRGAILVAANLNGCSYDANTFDGATIDERTVFPDGSSLQGVGKAEICERWPGIIIKEAVF